MRVRTTNAGQFINISRGDEDDVFLVIKCLPPLQTSSANVSLQFCLMINDRDRDSDRQADCVLLCFGSNAEIFRPRNAYLHVLILAWGQLTRPKFHLFLSNHSRKRPAVGVWAPRLLLTVSKS